MHCTSNVGTIVHTYLQSVRKSSTVGDPIESLESYLVFISRFTIA